MRPSTRLAFWAVALFLCTLPLGLGQPGVPGGLKADEAAYYLMAQSLAHDFDLELAVEDTERLFVEFPLRPTRNVIVLSDDRWQTLFYGKPLAYPLLAAPFVRLFGADGMLLLNLVMLMGMVLLGYRHLKPHNDEGVALAFALGFYLVGIGFAYAFWLQPEVFNMASVALALALGLDREIRGRTTRASRAALAGSGAALALGVYNKPMLLAFCLPFVLPPLFDRGSLSSKLRRPLAWGSGFLLALAVLAGLSQALISRPTPYLGAEVRQGVKLCAPGELPPSPFGPVAEASASADVTNAADENEATADAAAPAPRSNSFSWLVRIPEVPPGQFLENVGYFLWGRHTGLLVYVPFTLLALGLFVTSTDKTIQQWLVLAANAIIALYFLVYISWNWQGGGGFVGNRYFVMAIPAFVFLVRRIEPPWAVGLGYLAGGLLIGPLLFSPFGVTVPEPTLQAHTRNSPLKHLPLELTLRNLPGYHREALGDLRLIAREDRVLPRGDGLWTAGAGRVEILVVSPAPLGSTMFRVQARAPGSFELRFGRGRHRFDLESGQVTTVALDPGRAARKWLVSDGPFWVYDLSLDSERGQLEHWTRIFPPNPCPPFNWEDEVEETFFAGAELHMLGPNEQIDVDRYRVRWGNVQIPEQIAKGSKIRGTVTVTNASDVDWTQEGAARVKVSYHWLSQSGEMVEFDGLRSELRGPLPAGESRDVQIELQAPSLPGRYHLQLDALHEYVAWFSQKRQGNVTTIPIVVFAESDSASPTENASSSTPN